MTITTSCHCGSVFVEMRRPVKQLTRCNCSICRRYGALWAYQQRKAVSVRAKNGALKSYSWGKKSIAYFRCASCGCVTHYERTDRRPDGSDMSAVNMRNIIDPAAIAHLPIRLLDGAETWKVLKVAVEPNLLATPPQDCPED